MNDISIELWRLIDEVQRETLREAPLPDVPPAARLIAPLSPEEAAALAANDQASAEADQKIHAMNTHPAKRAPYCGRLGVLTRRELANGGVEDAASHPLCKTNACAYCTRIRLIRAINQGRSVTLDAGDVRLGGVGRMPRVEPLHMAEVDWRDWPKVDRRIRRVRRDGGRLRLRRRDGAVLIIAERPFRGSLPVAPPDALRAFLSAVDEMDLSRHSFRLLGRWKAKKEKRGKVIHRARDRYDLDAIRRELAAEGIRSRSWTRSGTSGLSWRASSAEAADAIHEACPSLSLGTRKKEKTNSDTDGDAADSSNPFEDEGYDPGRTLWG